MMNQSRKEYKIDGVTVLLYPNKDELGASASDFVADVIQTAIQEKGYARVIFATGASQFEFLSNLIARPVSWSKVDAFHLDEYVGLPITHPASFRKYLNERLFDHVKPRKVHLLDGEAADLEEECQRYTQLLLEEPVDLACIGIGENGHIAFNDPPVADFNDPLWVKVVELDEACRKQQFGEGWFPSIDDVPAHALTLTVPAILRSTTISCVVPDERKAGAVRDALFGPVTETCPASALRKHSQCFVWLDHAAASKSSALSPLMS